MSSIREHRYFGSLKAAKDLLGWEGEVAPARHGLRQAVRVYIEAHGSTNDEELAVAESTFRSAIEFDLTKRETISNKLLQLYSEWNDGDGISAEEFCARICLEYVCCNANGSGELYYQDGDMFEGHYIHVRLDMNHVVQEILLAG